MLEWDAQASLNILQLWYGYPRWILLALEWSVHGLVWLPFSCMAFIFAHRWNYPKKFQYKLGVLVFGIILDLILVGIIKIAVRRQRPPYNQNDQVFEAPVADKYSFPSGHTSRTAMLAIFIIELMDIQSTSLSILIHTFPVILGLSRIALGRHYLTDVIGGIFLGSIEALIALNIPPALFIKATSYIPVVFKA